MVDWSDPQPAPRNHWLSRAMNVVMALAALAGAASLAVAYGGLRLSDALHDLSPLVNGLAVAVLLANRAVRMALSGNPSRALREHWLELALPIGGIAAVAAGTICPTDALAGGALYVVINQLCLLAGWTVRTVCDDLCSPGSGVHPAMMLIGCLAFLVLAGSGLLFLPAAILPGQEKPFYYIDALFTAASAACDTGLTVRDVDTCFSPFGQAVLLVLMQLGALAVLLYGAVLAMVVGQRLQPPRDLGALGETSAAEQASRLYRWAAGIVVFTLAIELAGAAGLYPMFRNSAGLTNSAPQAAWYALFHSVSAFCNGGFSLYDDNLMAGVHQGWPLPIRDRWQVLGIFAPLIVLGGLGLNVLHDTIQYIGRAIRRLTGMLSGTPRHQLPPGRSLSLHTQCVLWSTVVLLVAGTAGMVLLEPKRSIHSMAEGAFGAMPDPSLRSELDWVIMNQPQRIRQAAFESVSARTAGFKTLDLSRLSNGTKLWMGTLMFIGGSPGSTAGGVKTTTVAVLFLAAVSALAGRSGPQAFGRKIPPTVISAAITALAVYAALVLAVTLGVCLAMGSDRNFLDILFESLSACGSVGLSTGLTAQLTDFAKQFIIVGMFLGRVTVPALMLWMALRNRAAVETTPAADNIVIG